jgi:predicted CDP-diglyceride synthetase/phosphatidate cytidylyltransferase
MQIHLSRLGQIGSFGLSTILVGTGLYWIKSFTPLKSMRIAALIVTVAFLGRLVLSAINCTLGPKDWGNMIEGLGAMLDRRIQYVLPRQFYFIWCAIILRLK